MQYIGESLPTICDSKDSVQYINYHRLFDRYMFIYTYTPQYSIQLLHKMSSLRIKILLVVTYQFNTVELLFLLIFHQKKIFIFKYSPYETYKRTQNNYCEQCRIISLMRFWNSGLSPNSIFWSH